MHYYHTPPPRTGTSCRGLIITLTSVFVAHAVAISLFLIFFRTAGPMISLGRAMDKLSAEVVERFNGTPLNALVTLTEILEDGTMTVNFDYTSNATIFGGWLSDNTYGSIKLSSDSEARDYILAAQVNMFGEVFDIDVYMNRERMAMRLLLLGDAYYGIRYDTFRDDIRIFRDNIHFFANLIGLDDETMDELSDIVDEINRAMNAEQVNEDSYDAYIEIFTDFFRELEVTSRWTRIESAERHVICREVELRITRINLMSFLNTLYEALENDEAMLSQLDMYYGSIMQGLNGEFSSGDNQLLRAFRTAIRNLQRSYTGDITLSFFIGRGDRLLRFKAHTDTEYDGERNEIKATLDFGRSVHDSWVLDASIIGENDEETITIEWDYGEYASERINIIDITVNGEAPIQLFSMWETNGGNFRLHYAAGLETRQFSGVLTTTDNSFYIAFDDFYADSPNESLIIEVVAVKGAQIGDIEFINIDKWGNSILDLFGLIMPALF